MATYYVNSAAAGTNAGTSWTNAYTAFGSAVTAATSAGDVILVHYTHQEELGADTTYTMGADNIRVISVNKDSSDAPTVMDTGGWIGNSTTNRSITLQGSDRKILFSGITFRVSGSTGDNIVCCASSGAQQVFRDCYFWLASTAAASGINLGSFDASLSEFINCTFRFGATGQTLTSANVARITGGSVSSAGSAPTVLYKPVLGTSPSVMFVGVDLSHVTGTLVDDCGGNATINFDRCKLGSGVSVMAAQTTNPTGASCAVMVTDCASGDTHTFFGFYSGLGSLMSDTGIYFTSGAAVQSWKIVTTANASFDAPFRSPPISLYNAGTSAITPYLEMLRDGSATAYDNDEVWAELMVKSTSGVTLATRFSDSMSVTGTPEAQANGAGTGSWTGENATAWSGKIDSGSAVTPAEVGELSMRVCVGLASATVYIDPQIRT